MKSDFYSLLERLNEAGVDFVIIGGFAGVIHGCTVVTQDIDICCDFSKKNLLKLQNALEGLNPVHRMTPGKAKLELTAERCRNLKKLYLDTDLDQLDCIGFVQGVGDFQKVRSVSSTVTIDNVEYQVLNIDGVIQSKKALGRESDGKVLRELEAIKKMKDGKQKGQKE